MASKIYYDHMYEPYDSYRRKCNPCRNCKPICRPYEPCLPLCIERPIIPYCSPCKPDPCYGYPGSRGSFCQDPYPSTRYKFPDFPYTPCLTYPQYDPCNPCNPYPPCPFPPIPPPINQHRVRQTNLVSNLLGTLSNTDITLINPRGMVIHDDKLWVAVAGSSKIAVRTLIGTPLNPHGLVYNYDPSIYHIPMSIFPATFITCTKQGTINAATGIFPAEMTVIHTSVTNGNYTGLAITPHHLYVANFSNNIIGSVDMFSNNFTFISATSFIDPNPLPEYAPFNVVYLNGFLYVLYARKQFGNYSEPALGPGLGYINIFNTNGTFLSRFATGGVLNAPWAMVKAPSFPGIPHDSFLIGNHGDGKIHIFTNTGIMLGQLHNCIGEQTIMPNLWSIIHAPSGLSPIYFSSGPNFGIGGLIGNLHTC